MDLERSPIKASRKQFGWAAPLKGEEMAGMGLNRRNRLVTTDLGVNTIRAQVLVTTKEITVDQLTVWTLATGAIALNKMVLGIYSATPQTTDGRPSWYPNALLRSTAEIDPVTASTEWTAALTSNLLIPKGVNFIVLHNKLAGALLEGVDQAKSVDPFAGLAAGEEDGWYGYSKSSTYSATLPSTFPTGATSLTLVTEQFYVTMRGA